MAFIDFDYHAGDGVQRILHRLDALLRNTEFSHLTRAKLGVCNVHCHVDADGRSSSRTCPRIASAGSSLSLERGTWSSATRMSTRRGTAATRWANGALKTFLGSNNWRYLVVVPGAYFARTLHVCDACSHHACA